MMNDAPVFTGREYETQLIGYALQEGLAQEFEELNTCLLTPEEEEMLQMAEKHMHKHLKLIDRTLRRRDRCLRNSLFVSELVKYAAACILVVSLTFGTALAASPKLRTEIVHYLSFITASYVEIVTEGGQATVQIPEGWLGDYYPAYIPEGYRISRCDTERIYSQIIYTNDNHEKILCRVYCTPIGLQADAENALCYELAAPIGTAYLYVMDSYSNITWMVNNQFYTFAAPSSDLLLDVFSSLTLTSFGISQKIGHIF